MNIWRDITLPKHKEPPVLRESHQLSKLLSHLLEVDRLFQNACLSVDMELRIVETKAHDVVFAMMRENSVELVILKVSVEIYPSLVEVW